MIPVGTHVAGSIARVNDPLQQLLSGAAEVVPEEGLAEKLSLGRPLRVKLGQIGRAHV